MEWAWPPTHREQQGAACPGAPLGHGNGVGSGWEFPKLLLVLRLEMGCSSCRGISFSSVLTSVLFFFSG